MTEHCSPWRALLSTLTTLFVLVMLLPPAGTRADADFESVRIAYDYEERSGRHGDPKGKYWHESVFHPHYDGRFTDHVLLYNYQRTNLTALMQSYLFAMSDLGAKTWISHGTLLGWWWNREIMPWDTDIDVQMTARSVGFLARYYNLTVHAFGPKKYMLEINPGFTNTSYTDRLNVIDARWIDIQTGLFIDITAVRTKPGSRGKVMSSKDRHEEDTQDLFPLRDTIFEGVPAKVPYNYLKLLTDEYGMKSISKLSHMEYVISSLTCTPTPSLPPFPSTLLHVPTIHPLSFPD